MTKQHRHITKKGSRILRHTLYNLVITHIRCKTEVGQFYQHLRTKGMHPKKAIVGAERKLAIKTYYDMKRCHEQN